jgi:short-subunit dehydrogenase
MKEIAIITGASSGIGYEIAHLFAEQKNDILMVGRNEQKLLNIKKSIEGQYKTTVYTVAADLSEREGLQKIYDLVNANNLTVTYLVNNAGFGDYGNFIDRSMEKYSAMISLNVLSLTELTYYYGRLMVKNGKGRILNVASTAGIQPDPFFAVYGATKAYVISLTEAIHKEFENTGVTSTVLSPGATATSFMERADMANAKLYEKGVMSAKEVALAGFQGMMKGRLHVIPGFRNKLLGFFSSITPSSKLRLNFAAKVMAAK